MILQSPRIYTYKITFEEVPYYYYGVKKEKYFNEEYWGSPYTHKWCWELYTPKKQILELFDYTDEGYIEAQKVEKRLIKAVYNTDKWCLNENCGGFLSLDIARKIGKKTYELGIGVHGRTKEEMIEHGKKFGKKAGKKAAQINKENGTAVFGLTFEERSEAGKKGALKTMEKGTGLFGMSPEKRSESVKKGALKTMQNAAGIHSMSLKEKSEAGKKGAKNTNSQKWMCTETAFVTTPGNLSKYQKARGIDTSKRKRIS
jgi:hypothetical protein